jgi:signal transduction histidine kinase
MKMIKILFVFLCVFSLNFIVLASTSKIDSLKSLIPGTRNPGELIDIYYDIASEYQPMSIDSLYYYAQLIQNIQHDDVTKTYAYSSLMYSYSRYKGHFPEAKKYSLQNIWAASQINELSYLSDSYTNLAIYYMEQSQLDSSSLYYKIALDYAQTIPDPVRVKRILGNYANVLLKQGNLKLAREYAIIGLTIDSISMDKSGLAIGFKLLGNIYLYEAHYDESLEAYQKAITLFEYLKDTSNLISTRNNQAIVYDYIKNYKLAEQLHLSNLSLVEKSGVDVDKISVLVNLGNVYEKQNRKTEQKKMLDEALFLAEKFDVKSSKAQINNNLGNFYYYENDFNQALYYFKKALEAHIIIGNKNEEALCRSNIGWAYMQLGNKNNSIANFEAALAIAHQIGSKDKRLISLDGLASVYAHFGDYKKAIEYKDLFISLNDSILGEKTQNRLAELQTLYESEKKEREIDRLKQSDALNNLVINEKELIISRLNWQRTVLGLSGLIIILIAFVLTRWIKIKKEKEKAAAILAEREAGLEAVFEATEEERKRIAKDLHDSVGQQLSGFKLAWQNQMLDISSNSVKSQHNSTKLSDILDDAIAEVRSISHQMMPRILQEEGLVPAISDMLEKVFRNSTVSFTFEHYGVEERLSEKIEIGLYRICQELVSNIIKHASASKVSVQLFKNAHLLILLVEDNGIGMNFELDKREGIGLLNISSRVETIHGEFNLEPSPISGTLATIRIPIN